MTRPAARAVAPYRAPGRRLCRLAWSDGEGLRRLVTRRQARRARRRAPRASATPLGRGRRRVLRPPRAGRCWPILFPARVAGTRRSPTTTRCCASRNSPRSLVRTWFSGWATCRYQSRCAHGSRASTSIPPGRARPRGRVAGPGRRPVAIRSRWSPVAALRRTGGQARADASGPRLAGRLARRRRARRGGDSRGARLARISASQQSPSSWACCFPRRRPCSSPPRCRCARSRRSGRSARTRHACCATAARTESTASSRAPLAPPRTGGTRWCC